MRREFNHLDEIKYYMTIFDDKAYTMRQTKFARNLDTETLELKHPSDFAKNERYLKGFITHVIEGFEDEQKVYVVKCLDELMLIHIIRRTRYGGDYIITEVTDDEILETAWAVILSLIWGDDSLK